MDKKNLVFHKLSPGDPGGRVYVDGMTATEQRTVTATEWGVSYLTGHGIDGARLNVHRNLDLPNQWGGRGVIVRHPEHDGRMFPSVADAKVYGLAVGILKIYSRAI